MAKVAVATAENSKQEDGGDSPLLDSPAGKLKKIFALGKERGYITYDELNEALPQDQMNGLSSQRAFLLIVQSIHLHGSAKHDRAFGIRAKLQTTDGSIGFQRRLQSHNECLLIRSPVVQWQCEVVFHSVVPMGRPGCTWVKGFEFGGLNLTCPQGSPFEAADGPRQRLVIDAEAVSSGISQAGFPSAADLHTADSGVDDRSASASRGWLVLLATECSLIQQSVPLLIAGGLMACTVRRECRKLHRP